VKPAAIYARFSSDLQRDRSIDDQVALCREYAQRTGYSVVVVFEDRAITGASLVLRHGMQGLLKAARTGAFEYVIAESMSRIGRDPEDRAGIRKRLEFSDVKLVTPVDGIVPKLVDGIRAVIDAQQLEDLKSNVRRALRAVVSEGRHPGGKAYGYRPVPGKPGEPDIVKEEAETVLRIFREYVAGESAREIAAGLNKDNVPPPRGRFWRANTIMGNNQRRTGILQNQLYRGKIIWNRASTVLDPDNHRRVRKPKAQAEWRFQDAPRLRIVPDDLFEKAAARRQSHKRIDHHYRITPKRILSGLLRCGCCGAGMPKYDNDHGRPRIICAKALEAGGCDNRRRYYVDDIEHRVVAGLQQQLGSREAIAHFIRYTNQRMHEALAGAAAQRPKLARRLDVIDCELERAVAAVIRGTISQEEADRHLPTLRREREQVEAELASLGGSVPVISIRPAAVATYLADLDHLSESLNANLQKGYTNAATVLRRYVNKVTVMPASKGHLPLIILDGDLSLLTSRGVSHFGGSGGAG
jgi:site-specific DNA recombinase